MFTLKKIRDQVYHLQFENSRELSMLFWRYQEFYESQFDHIRERSFTLIDHIEAYVRIYKEDPVGEWTYPSDWGGYNIPLEVVKQLIDNGIPDPNFYDDMMCGLCGYMTADSQGKPSYLIGTTMPEDDSQQDLFLRHEKTHAMFYVNEGYRNTTTKLIDSVSQGLKDELFECLKKQNYPEKTMIDEIQTYVTTGEGGFFDGVLRQTELDNLRTELRAVWRETYPEFYEEDVECSDNVEEDETVSEE